MPKPKNFAREWKTWRVKHFLSQKRLAAALGITERTVQGIESGKHKPCYVTQGRFAELVERYKRNRRNRDIGTAAPSPTDH